MHLCSVLPGTPQGLYPFTALSGAALVALGIQQCLTCFVYRRIFLVVVHKEPRAVQEVQKHGDA